MFPESPLLNALLLFGVAVVVFCAAAELTLLAKMVQLKIPWTRRVVTDLLTTAAVFTLWGALLGLIAGFLALFNPALLRAGVSEQYLLIGWLLVIAIALIVFVPETFSADEAGFFADRRILTTFLKNNKNVAAKARLASLAAGSGPLEFAARVILAEDERRPELLQKYVDNTWQRAELVRILEGIATQPALEMLKEILRRTSPTVTYNDPVYSGTQETWEEVTGPNPEYERIQEVICGLEPRVEYARCLTKR